MVTGICPERVDLQAKYYVMPSIYIFCKKSHSWNVYSYACTIMTNPFRPFPLYIMNSRISTPVSSSASSQMEKINNIARLPELEREDNSVVHRTVTAQDWTGPDDPENPHNWPMWQRVYHT